MRELIRVPSQTGLKITIQTLEPAEFRVVLVDNEKHHTVYDDIIFIQTVSSISTKALGAETGIMLIIKNISGEEIKFKHSVSFLRPRRPKMQLPRFINPGIRGGSSKVTSSVVPDVGGFLVQAAAHNNYVLQSANGGKIKLNG